MTAGARARIGIFEMREQQRVDLKSALNDGDVPHAYRLVVQTAMGCFSLCL
jgi:hypothetical protein